MKDRAIDTLVSARSPYRYDRKGALLMLGTYYAQIGRIAEAAAVYEELHEMEPRNFDVLVNLAAAASHRQDYAAMKRHLDRVLEIDPMSVQGRINMGDQWKIKRSCRSHKNAVRRIFVESLRKHVALHGHLVAKRSILKIQVPTCCH